MLRVARSLILRDSSTEEGEIESIKYVESVQFEINENYISEVYESCSQVITPSTGAYSMDMACGLYDSKTCSPKRWFQFMGDPVLNYFVPFLINYTYTNPEIAFTAETKKCNESFVVRHSLVHETSGYWIILELVNFVFNKLGIFILFLC